MAALRCRIGYACFARPAAYLANTKAASGRGRRRGRVSGMSYVDAALAPQRKTGQIKIHGAAAFESMRRAGRLAA